jgi:DNA-binding ferritin-like protein (Dps family)
MKKTIKFMDEYHKLRGLVEDRKKKYSFNDYINSLPKEKAKMMKEIRQYRNEVAFASKMPEISPNLDKWIEILQEEIKNLNNKKK